MWSERSAEDARENRVSRALREARACGRRVLDLTVSNPTTSGLPYDLEGLSVALRDAGTAPYRPEPLGLASAREAVARELSAGGPPLSADDVLLTSSTSEAYGFAFKLLCDPGDRVLVPEPSYPLLSHLARLESVELVPYRLRYDGAWHVDRTTLRIDGRTRAVVIINPNNPTGHFIDRGDLAAIEALGLPLIADEVFASYPLNTSSRDVRAARVAGSVLSLTLGGLSKLAGLPQLKCAWLGLAGPPAQVAVARERLELIADTYLSVSTPVQVALPRLLESKDVTAGAIRERIRENLEALQRGLAGSAASVLHVGGGWTAVLQLPDTLEDEAWVLALLLADVWVQPGFLYDFEHPSYVVVSLLTPSETLQAGVGRLVRVVGDRA